jgi:hypothetical protein
MIKSRRMIQAGHVAWRGDKMNAYKVLAGKPEGKRPLRRSRSGEGKTEVGLLEGKSAPVPICAPRISHGLS